MERVEHISIRNYGMMKWSDLFNSRQLLLQGIFIGATASMPRNLLMEEGYHPEWVEAINAYLAIPIDKVAAFNCTITRWFSTAKACAQFSLVIKLKGCSWRNLICL